MGTWGPGNFDDDSALSYVGGLCRSIEAEIEEAACSPRTDISHFLNYVMPRLAVLTVLVDEIVEYGPTEETVNRWRRDFLEIYDQEAENLGADPDFVRVRRNVILGTFRRLEFFCIQPDAGDKQNSLFD